MGKSQRDRRRNLLAAGQNAQHSSFSPPVHGASSSFWNLPWQPTPARLPTVAPSNYAMEDMFLKFLHESAVPWFSYVVYVDFDVMLKRGGLDLTIATCKDREKDWLKQAARKFLQDKNFGDEHGRSNYTQVRLMDFPKSMLKLQHFLDDGNLVETIYLFGKNLFMVSPTDRGRHLTSMLIAALFEYHSKGIFWDGEFDIADIVIYDYEILSKRIEILREPVKADNLTKIECDESKIKDMRRVAALINSVYLKDKGGQGLPLYFPMLIDDLEAVTAEEVGEPWFREHLSYHVALMTSHARKYLVEELYCTSTHCKVMPCMAKKPTMSIGDWRTKVTNAHKDIHDLFGKVFSHGCNHGQFPSYSESQVPSKLGAHPTEGRTNGKKFSGTLESIQVKRWELILSPIDSYERRCQVLFCLKL